MAISCIQTILIVIAAGTVFGSRIYNVTSKSYKEVVGDSPFVIFFFTEKDPNCELCALVYPKYVTVSSLFHEKETRFVRCVNSALIKSLDVGDITFPSVGFLSPSHYKPRIMNEPITVDSLILNIVERSEKRIVRPMRVSYTVVLTSDNFHHIVMNQNYYVMIFLHEGDSDVTKKRDVFESLAKSFKNDHEIVLATLDRLQERNLSNQFAMLQLPTLYWYDMTNKTKKRYGGQFVLHELVTFINDQTDLNRKPNGELLPKAGRVSHMDKLLTENIDSIVLVDNLTNVVKLFQHEADRMKNNKRFASYYADLIRAVKRAKTVKVLDDELAKLSLSLAKEELSPIDADDAIRRKNILQVFIDEIAAYYARDKERIRGELFAKDDGKKTKSSEKNRGNNAQYKNKKHLRDEL